MPWQRDLSWVKFSPGELVITPGAREAFLTSGHDLISELLVRHVSGDFGAVDEHDRRVNNEAIVRGLRVLSAYRLSDGTTVWFITEGDRSVTTILLPEEY